MFINKDLLIRSFMISVISSTNREGSYTRKIAMIYLDLLKEYEVECQLIDLLELPKDVAFAELYGNRSDAFKSGFQDKVEKTDKFVFVLPEYNGGFPGVLKLFVDAIPPKFLHGKKAGLVGVSSGAAGALRPMDQFSNILNYLRMDVIAEKPKLSAIDKALNGEDEIVNKRYSESLKKHVQKMIDF